MSSSLWPRYSNIDIIYLLDFQEPPCHAPLHRVHDAQCFHVLRDIFAWSCPTINNSVFAICTVPTCWQIKLKSFYSGSWQQWLRIIFVCVSMELVASIFLFFPGLSTHSLQSPRTDGKEFSGSQCITLYKKRPRSSKSIDRARTQINFLGQGNCVSRGKEKSLKPDEHLRKRRRRDP